MVAQIHRRNVDIVKLSSRHASRRQLLAKAAMASSRVGYSRASACPGGGGGGFGGLGGGGFGGLGVSMSATHPSMAARAAGERPNHPTPSGRYGSECFRSRGDRRRSTARPCSHTHVGN